MKKAGKSKADIAKFESLLELPALVPGTEHLIHTFDELSSTRSYGVAGGLPITFLEIKAYTDLFQTTLHPWEVKFLKAMDAVFLTESLSINK